jgi:predicted ATPase
MYIKSLEIKNIRAIKSFRMQFEHPAGWHVLIGDNGAGKSSIIRSLALMLVGPDEISGIKPNWNNWLQWKAKEGSIEVEIERKDNIDIQVGTSWTASHFKTLLKWKRQDAAFVILDEKGGSKSQARMTLWGGKSGWFSAGYGPFRRFTGGSYEMEKVFENPSYRRLASHLSLFGEDVALTEATKWLVNLRFQTLEKKVKHDVLDDLKKLINSEEFLPHGSQLKSVSSDGVIFVDGNGAEISVTEMSDGYRSILSLTFEMIRQLIRVYGDEKVFSQVRKGKMEIDLPGVVLIDEVDAHLHPTWQTRIGQWFIKYFPNIQFIVTSHSPLVCRACEHGSIWRLASPGSDIPSEEITGTDKNKLIFGNVLDAYGTDVFGKAITISKEGNDKRTRLGELNIKSMMGEQVNQKEFTALKEIFPTEKLNMK